MFVLLFIYSLPRDLLWLLPECFSHFTQWFWCEYLRYSMSKITHCLVLVWNVLYGMNKGIVLAHRVRNFRMHFYFYFFIFVILSYIKMLPTDAKTQKIKPDQIFFFWRMKVSEAVCKRDWLNVRSYLFFNVWKFRTQCAMTLTRYIHHVATVTWPTSVCC